MNSQSTHTNPILKPVGASWNPKSISEVPLSSQSNGYPQYHNFDEKLININKYRFYDFYFEELDKLNKKYYQTPPNEVQNINLDDINLEQLNSDETFDRQNLSQLQSLPVNIPVGNPQFRRYRLNTNNLDNSISPPFTESHNLIPKIANDVQQRLNDSHSSVTSNDINLSHTKAGAEFTISTSISNNSEVTDLSATGVQSLFRTKDNSIDPCKDLFKDIYIDYYKPSTSHQMIVKRVYDNYLCMNIDNAINTIESLRKYQLTNQSSAQLEKTQFTIQNILDSSHDFISDELSFITGLINNQDPFNLFNSSTIGLIFDRMNKSGFSFHLAHLEICQIVSELTIRHKHKIAAKQGLLDNAIGVIKHTANYILQPNIAVSNVLIKSLTEFIGWVYKNYLGYWMPEIIIQSSISIANGLSARFGISITDEIYATIKKYFIPRYLFSISRTNWKFTNIHKREIAKLRSLLIPPCYKNQWIVKCTDYARSEINWVYPDSPHIKNIIVFIDGRNWFYSNEHRKPSSSVNIELLRNFLNIPNFHNTFANFVYERITSLMTGGRNLTICDPRYIVPVIIFNERHRQQIQPIVPSYRTVIYTPRGQDDDLMTLYLWLSNPGSFIASNDNYGNHAARLTQCQGNNQINSNLFKYYEGLWSELTRCFKLINPISNPINTNKTGFLSPSDISANSNNLSPPF